MTEAVLPSEGAPPVASWAQSAAGLMRTNFGELLESMPDGIVMVEPGGRIVLANSQAERLFGYAGGELHGCGIDDLLPARFRAVHAGHREGYVDQPRKRAMGSGLDLWGLRRDGTEFPIEISLSPIRTDAGAFVLSAIRDVSERKRIERVLQEKNDELARANAAKDRFLANMSHELRTPLNAVIGFTGTLLMKLPGPLNDEQEHQLRMVQRSGRHLLALINDLLDVARIAAGKVAVHLVTLDLRAVVEDVAQTLRQQAQARGLALRTVMPAEAAQAVTDRRLLSQILLNLVGNALKFTEVGEVRITLEGTASHWRLRIVDTGPGIAQADQARLFEPFSRTPSAVAQRQEGSGLGLHLSRQLAGLLGGSLQLQSTLGSGSTFELHLPLAAPAAVG